MLTTGCLVSSEWLPFARCGGAGGRSSHYVASVSAIRLFELAAIEVREHAEDDENYETAKSSKAAEHFLDPGARITGGEYPLSAGNCKAR